MESVLLYIFVILSFVTVGLIIYMPISILLDLYRYVVKNHFNSVLYYVNLKKRYLEILEKYSDFYHSLDEKNKKLFRKRLAKFIAMKDFIPRGGLKAVTDEMKVLIGSLAIQITFGHPSIYFSHFYKILIYPDSYYSKISQRYHYGEVSPRGYIILSWRNFLEGWIDRSDGRNLGIHEMAHALHLENAIRNEEYDFLDFNALKKFDTLAKIEMERINSGNSLLFREYAGQNIHEFFAVMLENFFERPSEFNKKHEELYKVCTVLLNQNPLHN